MPTLLNENGLIILDKKITFLPYKKRQHPEREYLTDEEILANVGNTLFVNVESYPNYFLITFKLLNSNKFLMMECGENRSFNPKFLSWLMYNYRTIGFNSNSFDLNIIWHAYVCQNAAILKDSVNDLIINNMRPEDLKKKYGFFTYKTSHIDLLPVAPLKGSLKLYGARLHTKSIQEQPFDINSDLTNFEIEELKHFNFTQLCITEELFHFMKERLELRESMSAEYKIDLMSKSDAQIAEAVIPKLVAKLNGKKIEHPDIPAGTIYKYKVPEYISYATNQMNELLSRVKQAEFIVGENGKIIPPKILEAPVQIGDAFYSVGIGGLHSKDKTKAYRAVNDYKLRDVDVTSYYPNAIINMNLWPIALGPNFIKVFKGFKDERIVAKKVGLFTKDKGLKIFLNGMSGKLSDLYSKMRSPGHTIQMNLTGQLAILMLAEMFECSGLEVISANTDGLTVYYKDEDEEKITYWTKYWEKLTNFNLEDQQYTGYFARDVNAYFAVKEVYKLLATNKIFDTKKDAIKFADENNISPDIQLENGKVKIKGPWSEVGSQSGTKLDTNPIVLVCTDAIEALLSKNKSIEETILSCKDFTRFITVRQAKAPGAHWKGEYLGKVLRWAYIKGETDCIRTVSHNSKVADSDGCRPYLDLPDNFPNDINYDWYFNKTNEILEEIGYIKKPKQIEFF